MVLAQKSLKNDDIAYTWITMSNKFSNTQDYIYTHICIHMHIFIYAHKYTYSDYLLVTKYLHI